MMALIRLRVLKEVTKSVRLRAQPVMIGGEEHPNLGTVIDDRERKLQ
ncbi:hypothetical protein [Sphingobacterium daejeonense]|nr:hypothetical protein [Sphingobacterium daejeonense]